MGLWSLVSVVLRLFLSSWLDQALHPQVQTWLLAPGADEGGGMWDQVTGCVDGLGGKRTPEQQERLLGNNCLSQSGEQLGLEPLNEVQQPL